MFWVRLGVAGAILCGLLAWAFAQSNPGFQDGHPLCANTPNPLCPGDPGLNQAFMGKIDFVGPSSGVINLVNPLPVNDFHVSGSGALFSVCPLLFDPHDGICGATGTGGVATTYSAHYLKATAVQDSSIAEYMVVNDCNLNSGKGGAQVGSFNDAKVCQYNSVATGPNSGNSTWAQVNNLFVSPGDMGTFKVNTELDMANEGADCVLSMRTCYNLHLSGDVVNPITAFLAIEPTGTALNAHWGILLNRTPTGTIDTGVGIGLHGNYTRGALCFEPSDTACMTWSPSEGAIMASFTLNAPYLQIGAVSTFAGLPACNTGRAGLRTNLTDSPTPTFAAAAAGGGSQFVPVVCNGTNWING